MPASPMTTFPVGITIPWGFSKKNRRNAEERSNESHTCWTTHVNNAVANFEVHDP